MRPTTLSDRIHGRSLAQGRAPDRDTRARHRPPTDTHGGPDLASPPIPREVRFFDLFVEDAANVLGGPGCSRRCSGPTTQPERGPPRSATTEHRGDEISHDIGHRLEATFVTPFDREDIYAPDQRSRRRPRLHRGGRPTRSSSTAIEAPTATAVEQARDHRQAVELLHDALAHLAGFKGLDRYWIEVHRLENEGDRIVRAAIAGLFDGETDPINLVKWKEIYGLLEATIDKAEDVANIIERITIKHA